MQPERFDGDAKKFFHWRDDVEEYCEASKVALTGVLNWAKSQSLAITEEKFNQEDFDVEFAAGHGVYQFF